jgi:hypothetical protein
MPGKEAKLFLLRFGGGGLPRDPARSIRKIAADWAGVNDKRS